MEADDRHRYTYDKAACYCYWTVVTCVASGDLVNVVKQDKPESGVVFESIGACLTVTVLLSCGF